jgi:hypothetical protein
MNAYSTHEVRRKMIMFLTRRCKWFLILPLVVFPSLLYGQACKNGPPAVGGAGAAALIAPTGAKPGDGSSSVAADTSLSWNGQAGASSFDVNFGTANPPPFVVNQTGTKYPPGSLQANTTYYWSVTACNGTTPGPTAGPWKFTTTDSGNSIPTTGAGAQTFLQSMGFGVALSLQWNAFGPPIVSDATVDANGIVRVNTRANTNAGFMLEAHALPWSFASGRWGWGPFVAVQPGGTSQIISAVGAGALIDWKLSSDASSKKGFGLGFGYAAIPAAKTLGDEFVPNQPAPTGPGGTPIPVRFETRDKGSILLILSFTFR